MKTITEFTHIEMKEAFKIRHQLLQEHRRQPKSAAKPAAPAESAAPTAPASDEAPKEPSDPASETPVVEKTETLEPVPAAENPAIEPSVPEAAQPTQSLTPPPVKQTGKKDLSQAIIKSPEELFEERQAERARIWQEQLDAVKPHFLSALQERFKWSDERASHAFTASEAVRPERVEDLRAVRVLKSEKEGEKLPPHARKVGEFILIAEYYPSRNPEKPRDRQDRKGRKRGGKGGKGNRRGFAPRRDGQDRPSGNRTPRGPQKGQPAAPKKPS